LIQAARALLCTAAIAACCLADAGEPLRISVASSLKPAVSEALDGFPSEEPPLLNAAASGVLLQQAVRGAPVDVFLSASPLEIERLVSEGLALGGSRRLFASNRLVVIAPCDAPAPGALDELRQSRFDRIAVANPRTAPLGRYTRQALEAVGLWEALAPRRVLGENARQVADYVSRGEAPAGIVYRTDAMLLVGRVCVGLEIPSELHSAVAYEGVVIRDTARPREAEALLDWLASGDGRAALARHGFLPPAP